MEDFLVTFGSPLLPQYPVLNTCVVRAACAKAAKCLVLDDYGRDGFDNYIGVASMRAAPVPAGADVRYVARVVPRAL